MPYSLHRNVCSFDHRPNSEALEERFTCLALSRITPMPSAPDAITVPRKAGSSHGDEKNGRDRFPYSCYFLLKGVIELSVRYSDRPLSPQHDHPSLVVPLSGFCYLHAAELPGRPSP
jgi:hypothetical protein